MRYSKRCASCSVCRNEKRRARSRGVAVPRPPCVHHCTSLPYRFFGRTAELALLNQALASGEASLVALVGPGGQGKTAIVQHWLESLPAAPGGADGVFLWSFYRGKDADLCLRELYA